MGRGLIIALIASLALNVFAAGFITARLIGPDGPPPPVEVGPRAFDNPFRLMGSAESLPPESRRAFRAAFETQLPTLRAGNKEMRRLRQELHSSLSSEEWEREKIAEQMAAIRDVQARQREAFDAAFMAAFDTLSTEDRRAIIEAAHERRMDRRKKFRRRLEERRGPPPPPQ